MAHTNHTTNYELSQFLGTDKPSWLNDYNGDMLKIDTAIKDAADEASTAYSTASGLSGTVGDHTTAISNIDGDITDLQGADTRIEGKADEAEFDAQRAAYFTISPDGGQSYPVYTLTYWAAHGFLTSAAKEVNIFIDLPRMFNPDEDPHTLGVSVLNVMLKGVTGNLYGSTYQDLLNDLDVNVTVSKAGTNQVRIKITFANALDSNANNCPVEAYGTIQLKIV